MVKEPSNADIQEQIAQLNQDMGQRFLALNVRMDERLTRVDERFDGIDARLGKMDGCIDTMSNRVDALCKTLLSPLECRAVGVDPDPSSEGRAPLEGL